MFGRSSLVAFAVVGLLVGALAGYMTRPEATEIKFGPLNIEVKGNEIARDNGPLTVEPGPAHRPDHVDRRRHRNGARLRDGKKRLN